MNWIFFWNTFCWVIPIISGMKMLVKPNNFKKHDKRWNCSHEQCRNYDSWISEWRDFLLLLQNHFKKFVNMSWQLACNEENAATSGRQWKGLRQNTNKKAKPTPYECFVGNILKCTISWNFCQNLPYSYLLPITLESLDKFFLACTTVIYQILAEP